MKDSIQCKTLPDLHNDDYKVLWLILKPKRLPRGFSNFIAAVLYHPPDADNAAVREYLKSSLENVESNYSNSAIILAGDFNKLDFKAAGKCYRLKPIIEFPTRGANTLDQIYTNLQNYFKSPTGVLLLGCQIT